MSSACITSWVILKLNYLTLRFLAILQWQRNVGGSLDGFQSASILGYCEAQFPDPLISGNITMAEKCWRVISWFSAFLMYPSHAYRHTPDQRHHKAPLSWSSPPVCVDVPLVLRGVCVVESLPSQAVCVAHQALGTIKQEQK